MSSGNRDTWSDVSNEPQGRFGRIRQASVQRIGGAGAQEAGPDRLSAGLSVPARISLTTSTLAIDFCHTTFAQGDLAGPQQFGLTKVRFVLEPLNPRLRQLAGRLFGTVAAQDQLVLGLGSVRTGRIPPSPPLAPRRDTTLPPLVDRALFASVQNVRDSRRGHDGRPPIRRVYPLSMLHCAGCGRRLIGDASRYRHVEPCEPFMKAARPRTRRWSHRTYAYGGQSYPAEAYESLVVKVLERVKIGADLMDDVTAGTPSNDLDQTALDRIRRARESAASRFIQDRDLQSLTETLGRLDAEEAEVKVGVAPAALSTADKVAYLRDLPRLWADAPDSRRVLAESLFKSIKVLGARTMHLEPTAAAMARGFADAFWCFEGGYGRGEWTQRRGSHLRLAGNKGVVTNVAVGHAPMAAGIPLPNMD